MQEMLEEGRERGGRKREEDENGGGRRRVKEGRQERVGIFCD